MKYAIMKADASLRTSGSLKYAVAAIATNQVGLLYSVEAILATKPSGDPALQLLAFSNPRSAESFVRAHVDSTFTWEGTPTLGKLDPTLTANTILGDDLIAWGSPTYPTDDIDVSVPQAILGLDAHQPKPFILQSTSGGYDSPATSPKITIVAIYSTPANIDANDTMVRITATIGNPL